MAQAPALRGSRSLQQQSGGERANGRPLPQQARSGPFGFLSSVLIAVSRDTWQQFAHAPALSIALRGP